MIQSSSPAETSPSSPSAGPDDRDALEEVDVVVIGGGPAGLNAALMLVRSRRSVAVIDAGEPRNGVADGVHGLLGREGMAPADLLRSGREEVAGYGGRIIGATVVAAEPAPAAAGGDLRFRVALDDGRTLRARRLVVATGVRDILPDVPGLAEHWGHGLVHCPYCHGWEVRDEAIGILATGPMAVHQAWLFRQLSEDIIFFAQGAELEDADRERMLARGIRILDEPVAEVLSDEDGLSGVRLADGTVVPRRVLAVMASMEPRIEGLEGLALPIEELPPMGRHVVTGMAGTTTAPGVWVAGNTTEMAAQVGASAAAGAMAGAHINADLAMADTDAALAAARAGASADEPEDLPAVS